MAVPASSDVGSKQLATDENRRKDEESERRRNSEKSFRAVLAILGYALTCGCGLVVLIWPIGSARLALSGLFVGLASAGLGAIMGFLFGIPRTGFSKEGTDDTGSRAKPSNSLEQVADWLTKLLLGASLTQLAVAPEAFQQFGEYIAGLVGVAWAAPVIVAITIYFAVMGFLIAYLYTRLDYTQIVVGRDLEVFFRNEARDAVREVATETVERAANVGRTAAAEYLGMGSRRQPSFVKKKLEEIEPQADISLADQDPNKGKFGKKPTANGRRLSARVEENENPGWYDIFLTVESTDPKKHPLTETVWIFLHPTFVVSTLSLTPKDNKVTVTVPPSYGSFTVGVIADEGKTELELDLAELPGVPKDFID